MRFLWSDGQVVLGKEFGVDGDQANELNFGSVIKDIDNKYWALYSVGDEKYCRMYLDLIEFENNMPKEIKPSTTEQPAPVFKKEEQNPQ